MPSIFLFLLLSFQQRIIDYVRMGWLNINILVKFYIPLDGNIFFSPNESLQLFNFGDIVFISGKYVVENHEECVTVTYANIIDIRKPEREFDMTSVSSMRFKHLDLLGINIKVTNNYLISGFIKFSDSSKMLIEATDIDYSKSSIYNLTVPEISFDKIQKTYSIIDIIADDSKSTEIKLIFEQKSNMNLEAENDNEEQQSNHKEAENDNEKQQSDYEEEKEILSNKD
ncbi:14881_t:CDS:2, partial [Dentiscutata erythropus]